MRKTPKPKERTKIRHSIKKLFQQGPRSWCFQCYYFLRELIASDERTKDIYYLKRRYLKRFHRHLSLENPLAFTEKMQWLKLYDRNPSYTRKADKYAVREFVKETIGEQYLVKLLGIYDRAEDIDFDALPDRFALKATHGSHWNVICPDKNLLDRKEAIRKLNQWLKTNHYCWAKEWVYKDIPPRVICEEFLDANTEWGLLDYKIYCFNEKPALILVSRVSSGECFENYYDTRWHLLPVTQKDPPFPNDVPPPPCLEEMLRLASLLAQGTFFVRVDFYYHNEKIIFGELTFYSGAGYSVWKPMEFDYELGKQLKLPFEQNATSTK